MRGKKEFTMGKNKKRIRLTIEGQLEHYYQKDKHAERNQILWHAWCQNKRWLSQLLEITMGSFPAYSRHDESHAKNVLHNIEMILSEERIKELSASDCFILLHTVYIHDIGMVITYEDRNAIVNNDRFIDMIKKMEDENDPVFQRAIKALQKRDYSYHGDADKEEQLKKLYTDKLAVYYAILHLIASFRRPEHGELSNKRLEEWTLKSEKLGSGFSMAGIPQRIFLWISKCAGLHTASTFEHIMELPQEDNGYASDYLHPRFVAVLLQLGDILDMDNNRFHPLTRECIGALPELSERHYEKHQAIRRLYIKRDKISIEADCASQEALRLVRKECDMLRDILTEAGYYWSQICPEKFSGSLPTIESVKLYLQGFQIPEELVTTQFKISQKKAFAILEGSNVYRDQFVFLREFLQNAIDASKIQYWNECIRTRGYFESKDSMKKMSPNELEDILSTNVFPIEIEMEIAKQNDGKVILPIEEKDIKDLLNSGENGLLTYGVKVRIKDFGTGIDKESIKEIARVGDSRKRDQYIIHEMPEWLKPTAEFGIGLQSAFILTNTFKCNTYTRSNEKYEITFSTVKSNYYEGFINVRPVEKFEDKDNSYGTCFEVFVPVQKKLVHELCPAAWDGKDYFDKNYEELRPLRHAAELLAQMALYLDSIIGEHLFPIHLTANESRYVTIPLNLSEKNQIKKLNYLLKKEDNRLEETGSQRKCGEVSEEKFKNVASKNFDEKITETMVKLFSKRDWERSGKTWAFYFKKYEKNESEIVVEKTEDAIALLDCRDGHLYYWDNHLCTFCLINMVNFLLLEKRQIENSDKDCEKTLPGVTIYYKGIILDEIELPGIGNELLQCVDIKGKLEREYVSLSRKGFTEKGKNYFLQKIYTPLLNSVLKTLKVINSKHAEDVMKNVKKTLDEKVDLLKEFDKKIDLWKNKNEQIAGVTDQIEWIEQFEKKRKQLSVIFKENAISLTMLAFFAQKNIFDPLIEIGCGNLEKERCCWAEVIERIRKYFIAENVLEKEERSTVNWAEFLKTSVLFRIRCRPQINLQIGEMAGNITEWMTFPDIFSNKNQFMIVSKRENKSAPWKQFLTPIWSLEAEKEGENLSIVQCLKKYSIMRANSTEKERMEKCIIEMGKNALSLSHSYGTDSHGNSDAMEPEEYLQQYFLKWLLRYIPTVAIFMSNDGNTRINIIHGVKFPFVFMDDATKKLILQRIIEESETYDIQRFSIPAWQGLESISCTELPYSLYFIKRGYMAKESYSKVIFPFDKEELNKLNRLIHTDEAPYIIKRLELLKDSLNIRKRLMEIIPNSEPKIDELLEGMDDDSKRAHMKEVYSLFIHHLKEGSYNAEKAIDRVRSSYRELILYMLHIEKQLPKFSLDKFEINIKNWEYVYLWLLLNAVYNLYTNISRNSEVDFLKKEYEPNLIRSGKISLASAWYYVLTNQYIQNEQNLAGYRENYENAIGQGSGNASQKQESILTYIEKNRESIVSRDYLRNCWMRYIAEVFELFQDLEEEQYHVMEDLADWDAIENARKGNTNGADNEDREGL